MDFRNQPIVDILLALAEVTNTSIIADETVTGSASFHFSDSTLEESLALFLSTCKLYYVKTGNVYKISRISSDFDASHNLISMKADSVEIESLIRALAKSIGVTILTDPLPKTPVTVDIEKLAPSTVLEILTRRIPEYAIEKKDSYYYVKRLPTDGKSQGAAAGTAITRTGDVYSLSLDKGRFLDILTELFRKSGKEYSLLTKTDVLLDNMYFSGRDFDGILRLILEQGNADAIEKNGVYYIVELQKRDIVKKLKDTTIVPLVYISSQDLPALLPGDLASGSLYKIDKNTNSMIFTGSDEEIGPILDFIKLIDRPLDGLVYERIETKYLKAKDLLAIIPQKLIPIPPVPLPDGISFIVLGTPECLSALKEYIAVVDRKNEGYPIRLQYVKTDELLKALPPSISKDDIVDSGYPNVLFFTGSESKRQIFLAELESIDRPKPQIRYQLLVIQYNKRNRLTTDVSFKGSQDGSNISLLGNLSDILTLGFDVVSQFGYQFAANLSAQLSENLAQVYADTTLNGLSGQEIKFQNTNTSRFQEPEINEVTKQVTYTGVIREITSGLIVTLNGWVSGNDMITMNVNATVSKQNSNDTAKTGELPSTSERVVNTQVRTPSGKPIIISGLIQDDTNKIVKKIPLLGSIPLIGRLFRYDDEVKDKTEIVIYIVPHLSTESELPLDRAERQERYYNAFVKGASE